MPPVRFLVAAGRTVRVEGLSGLHFVLLAGTDALSQRWIEGLPPEDLGLLVMMPTRFSPFLSLQHPAIRHFMTADDTTLLRKRSHVQPARLPAFLVLWDGWLVDWFPAPVLAPGGDDPLDLLQPYLTVYHQQQESLRPVVAVPGFGLGTVHTGKRPPRRPYSE